VTKLSVGQGNMVTLSLVRRGVDALITKALVALSTIYTRIFNHKHIAIITVIRRNMHAICDLNTTKTLSKFPG
jgi:hypothetical protein